MGNKRPLHRMSKAYERAAKAQDQYIKRLETKKRVEKLRVKTQEEEEEKEEQEDERRPLVLVRVIDESKIITLIQHHWIDFEFYYFNNLFVYLVL